MGLIPDRLKMQRIKRGLKQSELAELAQISIPTITRLENGKTNAKIEDIGRIASTLNTSVAYLLGETDTPEPSVKKREIEDDLAPLNPNHRTVVRILPKEFAASCGWGIDWSWNSEPVYYDFEYIDPDPDLVRFSPVTGMHVMGDSMEPDIEDGDIVLFTDNPNDIDYAPNGSIVIVNYEGRMIVRGLFRKPDRVILKARNKDYEDIVVTGEQELRIIGLVLRIDTHSKPKPML
jgi:phage repressor protein C with HTH and peptisase S24 domain